MLIALHPAVVPVVQPVLQPVPALLVTVKPDMVLPAAGEVLNLNVNIVELEYVTTITAPLPPLRELVYVPLPKPAPLIVHVELVSKGHSCSVTELALPHAAALGATIEVRVATN